MSASGGLPMKIHGQDGRATTSVWQANSLPNAMKLSINMDLTECSLKFRDTWMRKGVGKRFFGAARLKAGCAPTTGYTNRTELHPGHPVCHFHV